MAEYVFRDGSRLTPYMFYQIERLNTELKTLFGVEVVVTSGIRLHQEQIDIFLKRYVTASNINGRRVYDTRVWNGTRYYRISNEGTVAVPGYSNHEIQGTKAAVDLRDTGSDAGISVANSVRGRWYRQNAWRFGLSQTGDSFNEGWHSDFVANIYTPVPSVKPNPVPPVVVPKKRKRTMSTTNVVYTNATADKDRLGAIVDLANGIFEPFGWFAKSYANGLAKSYGAEQAAEVTPGHYAALKKAAQEKATLLGKLFVDIDDKDVPKIQS